MNTEKIQQAIRAKLNSTKSYLAMAGWVDMVIKYPLVWIPLKDGDKKTSDAIDRLCAPFYTKYHTQFRPHVHDYMGSVVLISNENAVAHMINECAAFCARLDLFHQNLNKTNGRQELVAYYKSFTLKSKDVEKLFVEDMQQFAVTYNFTFDVRTSMETFKQLKQQLVKDWS